MKQWQKTLVRPEATIREVIETINSSIMQIALVVDENNVLVGTVTDGDIRRSLLRNISLQETIEKVMNKNPLTASNVEDTNKILAKMKKTRITRIPIVDENRHLVGMEVLEELLSPSFKDNPVILMAGGLGSRMSPLTDEMPKPLLRVGGRPILEIILSNFVKAGFRRFWIAVNYKAEMIEEYFGDGSRWDAEIHYIREDQKMGTVGALSLLSQRPTQPFFVMNGDLLTNVNFGQLFEFHQTQKAKLTMCVREYDFQVPFGVVKIDKDRITGIDEKPVHKFFVNAGIYMLQPEVLDLIPPGQFYDMPTLIEELVAKKYKTSAFPLREYWLDIGQKSDFDRANGGFIEEFEES